MTAEVEQEILESLLKAARGIKRPKTIDTNHLALGYHQIRSKAVVVGRRNGILMLGVNRAQMTMELFRVRRPSVVGGIDHIVVYYSIPLSDPRCMAVKHMAAAVRIHDQTLDAPVRDEYRVYNYRGVK